MLAKPSLAQEERVTLTQHWGGSHGVQGEGRLLIGNLRFS